MKKVIVISAVNIRFSGPLSILNDVLEYVEAELSIDYRVIALISNLDLIQNKSYANIEFIQYPSSIKSYARRLYLEYVHFRQFSLIHKPFLWLSMHDVTPNVYADVRAVYCHNASPFYNISIKEALSDKTFLLFKMMYKWVYSVNLKKNDYVIVQQNWLRDIFNTTFGISKDKIIVAYPSVNTSRFLNKIGRLKKTDVFTFFYPALPRVFKNHEAIFHALTILRDEYPLKKFEVVLTIDGSEGAHAFDLVRNFSSLANVRLLGTITRQQVYQQYLISDCLLFPSKLESWGLPLLEAKSCGLPIIASDLPFAHEAVNNYDRVIFFDPFDYRELANTMIKALDMKFNQVKFVYPNQPFSDDWKGLFDLLLNQETRAT